MAGLCFRVAAVPLHFYAPDVYQGSPMVVAATAVLGPQGRRLPGDRPGPDRRASRRRAADDPLVQKAVMLSWIIAAATMIWGNFVALLQDNLKRLLAYSSIAHAGYLMVGVTAAFANDPAAGGTYYGSESIFFYLVAYALMTLGPSACSSPAVQEPAGRDGRRPLRPGLDPSLAGPGALDLSA